MEIVIEKGIPMLPPHTGRAKGPFSVVETMDEGDSFAFTLDHLNTVRNICVRVRKKTGRQFTVRMIDADTYRVWRVA